MLHTMSKLHKDTYHTANVINKLKTARLDDIIEKSGFDHIDIMFIDVEGGEYEVLKSFDWNFPVHYICIEILPSNKYIKEIKTLLKNNGFIFKENIPPIDELWCNDTYKIDK